ncbi:hypothetical protein B0H16DRAFT_1720431 [Mycena metata]|uniref:Uncharacterized protein n=1 Tax=Mycena metata TaxID=1033252 RepID=A0AAD7JAK1_9AGAR|nr:hypothetical protein B0H16DRAFT_1720431 [Mycena metata]
MSISRTTNDASPGGEIQSTNAFIDARGQFMFEYSWLRTSNVSPPIVKLCNTHAPHEQCDCDVATAPSSPGPERYEYLNGSSTPTRRSFGSDATVDDFFERPSADPKVSPAQLPPLCDEVDSDDELFNATHGVTNEETDDTDDKPSEAPGLDLLSRTVSWLSEVETEPWEELPEIPEKEFTFIAPADAPRYPSPVSVECTTLAPLAKPLDTLVLVASFAFNKSADKPRYHPHPSSDPEHFEPDKSLVSYLGEPGVFDTKVAKTHKLLVAHSDGGPGSYLKAPKYLQRLVRTLIATYPWIRVDVITPFETFPCPFPDCDTDIAAARSKAESHIRHEHKPAGNKSKLPCPTCERSLMHNSMGRHIFEQHRPADDAKVPGPLQCKLCDATCADAAAFEGHFGECQGNYTGEERTRAAKRRRITRT